MNNKSNSRAKIPLLKVTRTFLLISGFLLVVVLTSKSWEESQNIFQGINLGFFILSLLAACCGNLFLSNLFRHSLRKYGYEITPRMTNKLFFYGQIAKYIPGKIWSIVLQKSLLEKAGSTGAILFSNIDLMLLSITINATLAFCLILFETNFICAMVMFVAGVTVCLFINKSHHIYTVVRFILKKSRLFEKNPALHQDTISNKFIIFSYCVTWFFYLTAWFLMLSASFGLSMKLASVYIAFLNLSWIVGILSFFVPAGIGVREVVFIALAKYSGLEASLETLASIAVITRLWIMLQEAGGAGITFLWNLKKRSST